MVVGEWRGCKRVIIMRFRGVVVEIVFASTRVDVAMPCNVIQCPAMPCNAVCGVSSCNALQCHAMLSVVFHRAMPCNALQCHAMLSVVFHRECDGY